MWSINIQPVTHQHQAMGLQLLHWITPLCTQYINITCGQWMWLCSHFLVTPYLFLAGRPSLILCSRTIPSLFCQNNIDNWKNVVSACRNVNQCLFFMAPCLYQLSHVLFGYTGATNSVVLVWGGVFCLETAAVIKLTSCWVRCCQTLHITESPVCSSCSALIHCIFLTCGMRARQTKTQFKGFFCRTLNAAEISKLLIVDLGKTEKINTRSNILHTEDFKKIKYNVIITVQGMCGEQLKP